MPNRPFSGPGDPFEFANRIFNGSNSSASDSNPTFTGATPPSQTGLGTRSFQIRPNRLAGNTRQVMKWLVPEQPIIEMFVNPERVVWSNTKKIAEQRTKGGYALQYWGEDLTSIDINGTTGRSGIEGINILFDIYRSEQLQFDPYALFLQAERDRIEQENFDNDLLGTFFGGDGALGDLGNGALGESVGILTGANQRQRANKRMKPTLASLAFSVEMFWAGEVYRGFFTKFTLTESAEKIGLFDYSMNFRATQKRGFRQNFFGWHKSPTHGIGRPDIYSNSFVGFYDDPSPTVDVGRAVTNAETAVQEIDRAASDALRAKNNEAGNEDVDSFNSDGESLNR
jgi:hypothetical protein